MRPVRIQQLTIRQDADGDFSDLRGQTYAVGGPWPGSLEQPLTRAGQIDRITAEDDGYEAFTSYGLSRLSSLRRRIPYGQVDPKSVVVLVP